MYKIRKEKYSHEILACHVTFKNSSKEKMIEDIEGHGFSRELGYLTYKFRLIDGEILHLAEGSFVVNKWIHTKKFIEKTRKVISLTKQ